MKEMTTNSQIQLILDDFIEAFKKARKYLFSNITKKDFYILDPRSGDCTTALDPEVYEKYYKPIGRKYNMVLICEESSPYNQSIETKDKDYVLIIDPIDGTKNMMCGLPFGVNIAFGKFNKSENFTIGHIQCVLVADYLTTKTFVWIQNSKPKIIPPRFAENLEWGHYPVSCNVFEVPDAKSYIEPSYPEGEYMQLNLLKQFYKLFKETNRETNVQRRSIDTTGLRILEVADNNLFAYGDVRRATRVWDSIPSIKFLLETNKDLIVFDSTLTSYSDETIIFKPNNGSNLNYS